MSVLSVNWPCCFSMMAGLLFAKKIPPVKGASLGGN